MTNINILGYWLKYYIPIVVWPNSISVWDEEFLGSEEIRIGLY